MTLKDRKRCKKASANVREIIVEMPGTILSVLRRLRNAKEVSTMSRATSTESTTKGLTMIEQQLLGKRSRLEIKTWELLRKRNTLICKSVDAPRRWVCHLPIKSTDTWRSLIICANKAICLNPVEFIKKVKKTVRITPPAWISSSILHNCRLLQDLTPRLKVRSGSSSHSILLIREWVVSPTAHTNLMHS